MEPVVHPTEHIRKPLAHTWRRRLALFLTGVLAGAILCVYGASAPKSMVGEAGVFSIAPGASLKSVGTQLKTKGYIRSRFLFSSLVTMFGGELHISPGDYYFRPGEGVIGVARQVAVGGHHLDPIKVTIPEGENTREIATTLAAKLPGFSAESFLQIAKPHEGYLFPETYFLYPKTTAEDILSEMQAMFASKVEGPGKLLDPALDRQRSNADIVIMASLIEREAHGNDDRAVIAGILWKRLDAGMALQVDATVAYANGVDEGALTKAEMGIDSPYNTYKYKGLPPGPIANPGLLAIQAAELPAVTDYLYYLHDRHGTIHYAKTYKEHQANIAKYLE